MAVLLAEGAFIFDFADDSVAAVGAEIDVAVSGTGFEERGEWFDEGERVIIDGEGSEGGSEDDPIGVERDEVGEFGVGLWVGWAGEEEVEDDESGVGGDEF